MNSGSHSPLAKWAGTNKARWAAVIAAVIALLLSAYLYVSARDTLVKLQSLDDDREEALRWEQVLIDQAQARQTQCGGPEATVEPNRKGGWDCFDTNGRKTKSLPGLARPAMKPVTDSLPAFSVRDSSETECANSIEPAGVVLAGFLGST